jgi:hypothetical protein
VRDGSNDAHPRNRRTVFYASADRRESVSAEPVLTERIFYVTSVGFMACLPTAGKYTRHSVRKIAPQQSSHAKDESAHSFSWLGEKQIKVVLRREKIFSC